MKKIIALSTVLLLVFSSCNKYPDGPKISVLTKKMRVTNTWVISTAYENGVDKTSDFNSAFAGYTLTIDKSGSYTCTYRPFNVYDYSETGSWAFNSDKTHVIFTETSPSSNTTDWKILKLENKELWGQYTDNNTLYEVHLSQK